MPSSTEEADFLKQMRDLTIHDFNFYPVAAELKNNTYEVRIINYEPIDYKYYLSLFSAAADGKRIHFTKIKTDNERKQQIIDKHNIVKIATPVKPVFIRFIDYVKSKIQTAVEKIKRLLE